MKFPFTPRVIQKRLQRLSKQRSVYTLLWFLALTSALAFPFTPAHSGGNTPALDNFCLMHEACRLDMPVHAPSCSNVEHDADHQAVPQTGKSPAKPALLAAYPLEYAPSANTQPLGTAETAVTPVFLTTNRLRL